MLALLSCEAAGCDRRLDARRQQRKSPPRLYQAGTSGSAFSLLRVVDWVFRGTCDGPLCPVVGLGLRPGYDLGQRRVNVPLVD